MTEPAQPTCTYLRDRTDEVGAAPSDIDRRCYAIRPLGEPRPAYQADYCLTARHTECPLYRAAATREAIVPSKPRERPVPALLLPFVFIVALAIVVAVVYAGDSLRAPGAAPTLAAALATSPPPVTPSPVRPVTRVATAVRAAATAAPAPGGRILQVTPPAGAAGWWTSSNARGSHLGDSFLYAGHASGQVFISAARFELSAAPRGAPIRSASLRLTGLNADRFNPSQAGAWSVELLPAAAVPGYARAGYQDIADAPAAVKLSPTLFPADLQVGAVNQFTLDATALVWLAREIVDAPAGEPPAIVVRITGPTSGDSLFAWDSGTGPATAEEGPTLVLDLGPAPATPVPLPTEAVIVATETATPGNILTVAADAWTATAIAATTGTPTRLAYRYVTPTPAPANLATVQALALLQGLPPIIEYTPTPANAATATADAVLATAVAFLTGTPRPLPTGAVTPYYITTTPTPANILTVAARLLAATSQPAVTGTPLPYNAVVVTPFRYVIITATPAPANQATAVFATAVAVVYGTPTPLPFNWVIDTPTPLPAVAPPPAPPAALTPSAAVADCADPRAQITAPQAGATISGEVLITGRAASENFEAFAIVYASGVLPAQGYREAFRAASQVADGPLGIFVTTGLPNGVYTLRLITLNGAQPYPTCRIVVEIRNP